MNFCSHCGQELQTNAKACPECGEKALHTAPESGSSSVSGLDESKHSNGRASGDSSRGFAQPPLHTSAHAQAGPESVKAPLHTSVAKPGTPGNRKSGKIKLLLSFAIVLLAVLAGGYYVGSLAYSPDRTIQEFREAVEAQDIEKLQRLLRPEVSAMGVSDREVSRLAQYLLDHESVLQDIVGSLQSQADRGKADPDAGLRLVKDGKVLLFDKYAIEVAAYYMTIDVSTEDTLLFVDGRQVDTVQSSDYSERHGPFWPGEHEVKAVYAGELIDLEDIQAVTLFDQEDHPVSIAIEVGFVRVETEIREAELFVNGESTGRTIADLDGQIGPVTFNGTVTLQAEAEFPWGRFRSEEINLTEEHEHGVISFLFSDAHEAAREQVMEAVNEFLASWVPAYENMDISAFTNITEERRSLFASDFQWMLETGQRFSGRIVGTEFDLDSFELAGGYDQYPYQATIEVAYILSDAAWYYEGEQPQFGDMVSFIRYNLAYDTEKGQWLISYFTSLDEIDLTNTQAFTYE